MTTSELTAKQQKFIEEYLIDLNASAAARRAGYSEHTANRMGSENLTKPDIIQALNKRRSALRKEVHVTQDIVVGGLVEIAEDEDQPAAARVSAYMNVARILGYVENRTEFRGKLTLEHRFAHQQALESLTIDDIRALARQAREMYQERDAHGRPFRKSGRAEESVLVSPTELQSVLSPDVVPGIEDLDPGRFFDGFGSKLLVRSPEPAAKQHQHDPGRQRNCAQNGKYQQHDTDIHHQLLYAMGASIDF